MRGGKFLRLHQLGENKVVVWRRIREQKSECGQKYGEPQVVHADVAKNKKKVVGLRLE